MKVVQLLYSYLLTRSDFKIATPPEKDTRDNRFAYQTYLSTLMLMLEVSGYRMDGGGVRATLSAERTDKLATQVAKALAADSELRDAFAHAKSLIEYGDIRNQIYDKLISSTAVKDFSRKRNKDLETEVALWNVLLDTIIAKDEDYLAAGRRCEDFTTAGFNNGIAMVKATLNAYNDNRSSLAQARKALDDSLEKAYELYHLLLLLPVEITRLQEQRLESAKDKYVPTSEDLNPNTRFVDNEYVKLIRESEDMERYLKSRPINFDGDYLTVKRMLDDILASEIYKEYMEAPTTDRAADCEFWRSVMRNILLPSDALAEMLENSSVYWNDDLEIMGTFALKTIRQIGASTGEARLLPKFKDDDDAEFGATLFVDTVSNRETYRGYINNFIDSTHWDHDRLAFMDIVVMMVAISELINFPAIPIPVTLNEYIEIANSYSTPRSGQFVNGMLYSIIKYLKNEGKLLKD